MFQVMLSMTEQEWAPPDVQWWYKKILDELGLRWDYRWGNTPLIMWLDSIALKAAHRLPNFYPPEAVDAIQDKSRIGAYLGTFGFPELRTKVIHSADEIGDETNFILKPMVAQGGAYAANVGIGYKRFANRAAVLAFAPREEIDAQFANGFTMQQACMKPEQSQVIIRGTVNSKGEPYWMRNSVNRNKGGKLLHSVKTWGGYDETRALLSNFFKQAKVRNGTFNISFLELDGKLYPIDWHCRIGNYMIVFYLKTDYREVKRALAHQYDVETDLPDVFPGVWETDVSTNFMEATRA